MDIIKTGRKIWVEIYFVIEKDLISIEKLKCLHKEILDDLSLEFDSLYVELIPDVSLVKPDNLVKMKGARRPDKINYIVKKDSKKSADRQEKLKIKEIKKS